MSEHGDLNAPMAGDKKKKRIIITCNVCSNTSDGQWAIFCLKCKDICCGGCGRSDGNDSKTLFMIAARWPGQCGACHRCVAVPCLAPPREKTW